MRITGGSLRGRRLFSPKNRSLRPTSDKVREALFNILGERIENSRFLDAFSGTGAVGLEALSRGAKKAVLVEQSTRAIALIRKNAQSIELSPQIIPGDFFKIAERLFRKKARFDIIFIDPPYMDENQVDVLKRVATGGLLNEYGVAVVEYSRKLDMPKEVKGLIQFDERKYGDTKLSFYQRHEEN